jgi:hypothetical protein
LQTSIVGELASHYIDFNNWDAVGADEVVVSDVDVGVVLGIVIFLH